MRWQVAHDGNDDADTYDHAADDGGYLIWMRNLPRYYSEGNTIFVHAGIDKEAEDLWEWGPMIIPLRRNIRLFCCITGMWNNA